METKQKIRRVRLSLRTKHEKLILMRERDIEILKSEIKELDELFRDLDNIMKIWEKKIDEYQ